MSETKKFQLGDVLTISSAHLLHDIYSSFLPPILPLLIEKLSISYSSVGLLTLFQRLPSLLNPFVGIAADRMRMRYFIIIAPSITAVSMSLLGVAPSYCVLVILLLVMGVGATLFHVPGPVMIKNVAGDRIGTGMSFYMLGGEFARTLGPLTILAAVSLWGLEGTYRLVPFGLAASGTLYLRIRNIRIDDSFRNNHDTTGLKQTLASVRRLFGILAGITFFRAPMGGALMVFLPTYVTAQDKSLWTAGMCLVILQSAGVGGTILAGMISDRIGRRNVILIASVASPVVLWVFTAGGVLAIPMLILLGFLIFATGPVMLAIINDTNTPHPAFVNSVYMTISFAINAVMIFVVGLVADWAGLVSMYRLAALAALAAVPFVMALPKVKQS